MTQRRSRKTAGRVSPNRCPDPGGSNPGGGALHAAHGGGGRSSGGGDQPPLRLVPDREFGARPPSVAGGLVEVAIIWIEFYVTVFVKAPRPLGRFSPGESLISHCATLSLFALAVVAWIQRLTLTYPDRQGLRKHLIREHGLLASDTASSPRGAPDVGSGAASRCERGGPREEGKLRCSLAAPRQPTTRELSPRQGTV
jgi:hypothetical protein